MVWPRSRRGQRSKSIRLIQFSPWRAGHPTPSCRHSLRNGRNSSARFRSFGKSRLQPIDINALHVPWHDACFGYPVLHWPRRSRNGRRAKDGQASSRLGCPPGDRSNGEDEEQGASQEKCWFQSAPKQNNDKNNKQRSLSDPGPAIAGLFLLRVSGVGGAPLNDRRDAGRYRRPQARDRPVRCAARHRASNTGADQRGESRRSLRLRLRVRAAPAPRSALHVR